MQMLKRYRETSEDATFCSGVCIDTRIQQVCALPACTIHIQ